MKKQKENQTNQINKPPPIYVNLENTKYLIVHNVINSLGWKLSEIDSKILLYWCDSEGSIDFARNLSRWQFYNHFPGMWCIAHKCELSRLFSRMSQKLPTLYDFHPACINLPAMAYDLGHFLNAFSPNPNRYFIIKPDTGCQGKGIIITSNTGELLSYDEPAVAQEYISPLLLDGLKFDLRIYVLVTSVDPLRVYLYREGMVRFCTEPYTPPHGEISTCDHRYSRKKENDEHKQEYSQLTNFSLNKQNPHFEAPENADFEVANSGHKRSLSAVFKQLKDQGIDTNEIWSGIENIVRLTMIAAEPQLASQYRLAMNVNDGRCRCFEVLGFDILIDENKKPWLLEVNCMPSFAASSPFDIALKTDVITDALTIVDIPPNFKKKCTDRFLQRTMSMSSYISTSRLPSLFDPKKETEIAKKTRFTQLYPILPKASQQHKIKHEPNNTSEISSEQNKNHQTFTSKNLQENNEGDIMEQICSIARYEARSLNGCSQTETSQQRRIKEKVLSALNQKSLPELLKGPNGILHSEITIRPQTQSSSNQGPKTNRKGCPNQNINTILKKPIQSKNLSNSTKLLINPPEQRPWTSSPKIKSLFQCMEGEVIQKDEERIRIRDLGKQMREVEQINIKICINDIMDEIEKEVKLEKERKKQLKNQKKNK